ncbi:hypothetical protein [Acinetobacter rudis]|uniref:Uncharacterized protein n=1 Tax=Acinetobacter rudis TaxID=632955 RepID=A0AAW8JH06_9GAMM|nr:hypothetical protein [Acinetobacter rudis]MDQ8936999.1 hypothetical protein [Acinetobacter rudis]MDQ9019204.1 hypothetical protein [Acinetobacter rudis]
MSKVIMLTNKKEYFFFFKDYPDDYKFSIYFYLNGENVKTEWYKKSKFLRVDGYNQDYLPKVFVRNANDELVDQFYLKGDNLISDKDTILDILKNELENINDVKYIYTIDDKLNYENKVILLWMLSISDTHSTTYLLNICSVVKSWVKNYNQETLAASKMILDRNERTDAVIYYCFSLLAVLPWEEAQIEINRLFISLNDYNNINICKVFKALFSYESGNFDEYCAYIKSVIETKSPDFNHYLFTPLSTVYTKNNISKALSSNLRNNLFGYTIDFNELDISKNTKYIVSLSCNKKYFDLYYTYLMDTMSAHSENYTIFIFFSDGDESYYSECLSKYKNVKFFINNNVREDNIGPISSMLRYYYAYDLVHTFKKPVFVLDFDSVVFKDLGEFLNKMDDFDMASRILKKGVLPWEKYTGGFTVFKPTSLSIQTCLEIKVLTEQILSNNKVQWWVDQNILEAAIRQVKYRRQDLKIFNAIHSRDEYIKMPVGRSETKEILLQKMYDESLAI